MSLTIEDLIGNLNDHLLRMYDLYEIKEKGVQVPLSVPNDFKSITERRLIHEKNIVAQAKLLRKAKPPILPELVNAYTTKLYETLIINYYFNGLIEANKYAKDTPARNAAVKYLDCLNKWIDTNIGIALPLLKDIDPSDSIKFSANISKEGFAEGWQWARNQAKDKHKKDESTVCEIKIKSAYNASLQEAQETLQAAQSNANLKSKISPVLSLNFPHKPLTNTAEAKQEESKEEQHTDKVYTAIQGFIAALQTQIKHELEKSLKSPEEKEDLTKEEKGEARKLLAIIINFRIKKLKDIQQPCKEYSAMILNFFRQLYAAYVAFIKTYPAQTEMFIYRCLTEYSQLLKKHFSAFPAIPTAIEKIIDAHLKMLSSGRQTMSQNFSKLDDAATVKFTDADHQAIQTVFQVYLPKDPELANKPQHKKADSAPGVATRKKAPVVPHRWSGWGLNLSSKRQSLDKIEEVSTPASPTSPVLSTMTPIVTTDVDQLNKPSKPPSSKRPYP